MEHALVWVANGFDPDNPERTDIYSKNSLHMALQKYRIWKSRECHILFVLINSVVRNVSGGPKLADVLQKEAREVGVCPQDIYILPLETTGSPTDALAVVRFAKAHPRMLLDVFATSRETAAYFAVMYIAVARWLENCEPEMFFHAPDETIGLRGRILYGMMRRVTAIAALTRPSFLCWYRFLDRRYQRRKTRFTRTIH